MPLATPFAIVDRLLSSAERLIALLDRCRPLNAERETERVIEEWESGRATVPEYRYASPPDLSELVGLLESVASRGASLGPLGELYAARAVELVHEANLVEALGQGSFSALARKRFPKDDGPNGRRADESAARWIALPGRGSEQRVASDDDRDPRSLLSVVRSLVGSMRLPIRISMTSDLPSAAAAGDGFILIQRGIRHRPEGARRIALHEVLGHAVPRLRARSESLGLFAVGTARGSEDEEGRALLIEQRHGLFDDERRRDLGIRHVAALAVCDGADWVETVRLTMRLGHPVRESVRVAARVLRGGGLAREIVYLPARERVRSALRAEPGLERWLERGRIAVDVARILAAPVGTSEPFGCSTPDVPQRNVATTGA